MAQYNTILLKITFPELEKEFPLTFPRDCTVLEMYDIIFKAGVITDQNFLNQCHFFIPWSGIWMQKNRSLESYALCDEVSHATLTLIHSPHHCFYLLLAIKKNKQIMRQIIC
jgi:hypothetical protein